jgi:hypothetical protein
MVFVAGSCGWKWRWEVGHHKRFQTQTLICIVLLCYLARVIHCTTLNIIQFSSDDKTIGDFTPCKIFGSFWNTYLNQIQSPWSQSSKMLVQTILYNVETQKPNVIWTIIAVKTWKLTEYNSLFESSTELEAISISINLCLTEDLKGITHVSIQYINTRSLFNFQSQHDSFITQKACIYPDIPRQLWCSEHE